MGVHWCNKIQKWNAVLQRFQDSTHTHQQHGHNNDTNLDINVQFYFFSLHFYFFNLDVINSRSIGSWSEGSKSDEGELSSCSERVGFLLPALQPLRGIVE